MHLIFLHGFFSRRKTLRVLIADDSAIYRVVLEQKLSKEKDIEIVGSATNGKNACEMARQTKPDLVILDDKMPEMDGPAAAEIITSELGISAVIFGDKEPANLSAGSSRITFIKKPKLSSPTDSFFTNFIIIIRDLAKKPSFSANGSSWNDSGSPKETHEFLIMCIGASTGGPTAVKTVLSGLGNDFPLPILYVQHLDSDEGDEMAKCFGESCPNMIFSIAKNREEALPGHVYMAPAGKHLVVGYINSKGNPVLNLSDDPPVKFLKPSVDRTFLSARDIFDDKCLCVLLTGMGDDGAEGCKGIVDAGGVTIVEDESTCAVFGMPAEAIKLGGASFVLKREKIASKILSLAGIESKDVKS